jgi:hypothetical protein
MVLCVSGGNLVKGIASTQSRRMPSLEPVGYIFGVLAHFPYFEIKKMKLLKKLKLYYDRQSVGQSVLVSGTHLGPATNFSFSLKSSLDSCGFVIL